MTYMLTGKRHTQAIRALQRGRGPFMAYMQATKPPRKLSALEQLTKNMTAALRQYGRRVGEALAAGIAAGIRKASVAHTMTGATDSSVGEWGLSYSYPPILGLLRHSDYRALGLDRYGLKPLPPLSAIHYDGVLREGQMKRWFEGVGDDN